MPIEAIQIKPAARPYNLVPSERWGNRVRSSPVISTVFNVKEITTEALVASAKDFGARALTAHLDDDNKVVLMFAAMGLEHLCKGFLCAMHPALLLETKNVQLDSLLHLVGHSAMAMNPGKGPRTLSGRESLNRVKSVLTKLDYPVERIKELHDVRDGIVHVGLLNEVETKSILAGYLRLSEKLFDELKIDKDARWGDHRELVDALISESLSETERDVKRRIAAARSRIGRILAHIPDSEHASIKQARQLHGIDTMHVARDQRDIEATCPVCQDGFASFIGHPIGEAFFVYNDEFEPLKLVPVMGDLFRCYSCGLELNGPDEFTAAGLSPENFDLG